MCLLPCIFAKELVDIHLEDRAYVAAEMTAFLIDWLSSLDCPKLNPPTAGCFSGPMWRPEHWVVKAAAAGLPVEPLRRSTRPASGDDGTDPAHVTVTVVGRQCLGHPDEILHRHARALAGAADVGLLGVDFVRFGDSFRFCGADPFPDPSQAGVFEAIADYFNAVIDPAGTGARDAVDGR